MRAHLLGGLLPGEGSQPQGGHLPTAAQPSEPAAGGLGHVEVVLAPRQHDGQRRSAYEQRLGEAAGVVAGEQDVDPRIAEIREQLIIEIATR